MRRIFTVLFVVFILAYIGAEMTLDRHTRSDEIWLRWATDPAPSRELQIKAFEQRHPGIRVMVDPGVGNDQIKMIVQCATGVGPDIIDIQNQEQMAGLVEAGILLDLTPWATQMGFSTENTYPQIKNALIYEGKQYRYPCNVYARSLIYNKTIFDKLKIPYPQPGWTWADFIRIGKLIQTNQRGMDTKYVPLANYYSHWFVQDLMVAYGAHYYRDQGLRSDLDSKEAIQAMQAYYDMMHVDGVILTPSEGASLSSQGGWGSGAVNWFSGGQAAMIMIGRWFLVLVPHFPSLQGNLGVVELPSLPGHPPTGVVEARSAGINAKSLHPQEALLFLQYLASSEYGKIIVQENDSLPPNPNLARTGADLVNTLEPNPGFHQVFIDAIAHGQTTDISSFVDPNQVILWLMERIDKVENKVLTPEAAMKGLAREVNQQIRLNLERRPDLQDKFKKITGKDYTPSWWKTEEH